MKKLKIKFLLVTQGKATVINLTIVIMEKKLLQVVQIRQAQEILRNQGEGSNPKFHKESYMQSSCL